MSGAVRTATAPVARPAGAAPTRGAPPATRTTSGVCHGTLGELFQGPVVHRGGPGIGLVSFPVDRYSWAHFTPAEDTAAKDTAAEDTAAEDTAEQDAAQDDPLPAYPKAARCARLFLDRYRLRLPPGRWSAHSELDVGVGMASSTADMVATLRCLFRHFGMRHDLGAVIDILARIERADSVFLDEFALYLSDRHRVVHRLGTAVGFHTCFVVEPGAVDTAAVTPLLRAHYRRHRSAYRACLDDLLAAFRAGDRGGVARAATTSAALSQQVLPKAGYDAVLASRRHFGADGIFVAHTGRLIGYLFTARPTRARMDELSAFFRELGHQCSFAWGGHGGA